MGLEVVRPPHIQRYLDKRENQVAGNREIKLLGTLYRIGPRSSADCASRTTAKAHSTSRNLAAIDTSPTPIRGVDWTTRKNRLK
jgi:hypothetical protein